MKKILFATTALVATAGAAQADVALSGFAEIGILGGDRYATEQFHTDIDVTFTMTGEADNGLTFGAKVDLDENGAFGNTTQGGETYFIAFGGARIDMGDTDGAFDAALTDIGIGGSIADDHTTHAGYNGNAGMDGTYDGQIATMSYAFSGFTGYLSAEIDDTGTFDPVWGIGASYSADLAGLTIGVGLGYQEGDEGNSDATVLATAAAVAAASAGADGLIGTADDPVLGLADVIAVAAHERDSVWGISLNTTFNNGIQAILNYSEATYGDGNISVTNAGADGLLGTADDVVVGFGALETESYWGLGLGYTMNALTVAVNYGEFDNRFGVDGLEAKGYGLAVNYDLGGGLEAQAGYGKSEYDFGGLSSETDQYSLGLAMTF